MPMIYQHIAEILRQRQVHPDSLWWATADMIQAELTQTCPSGKPVPTSMRDALTPLQRQNLDSYLAAFRQAEGPGALPEHLWVAVAHKTFASHPSKSNTDGTLPTFLAAGTQKIWSFLRKRWLTGKEKAAAHGMCVTPELEQILKVPQLGMARRELHFLLGNSWHLPNAAMVLLAFLASVQKLAHPIHEHMAAMELGLHHLVRMPADGRCLWYSLMVGSSSKADQQTWRMKTRNDVGCCVDPAEAKAELQAVSVFVAPLQAAFPVGAQQFLMGTTPKHAAIISAVQLLGLTCYFWSPGGTLVQQVGATGHIVHLQICQVGGADHYDLIVFHDLTVEAPTGMGAAPEPQGVQSLQVDPWYSTEEGPRQSSPSSQSPQVYPQS